MVCTVSIGGSEEGGEGIDSMDESAGVRSGVGDCSCISTVKGNLCGRGERSISIESRMPGEDDGMEGVVKFPSVVFSHKNSLKWMSSLTVTVLSRKYAVRKECPPRGGQLWAGQQSALNG